MQYIYWNYKVIANVDHLVAEHKQEILVEPS